MQAIKRSWWRLGLQAVTLATGLTSCFWVDEDNIHLLSGGYYTASYDEGTALHWHEDPEKFADEPLLEKVYDTQQNDSYVIARVGTDFYFAFPLRVSSLAEAQQNRLGPFSKAELNRKMVQLTGDSTLRQVGDF